MAPYSPQPTVSSPNLSRLGSLHCSVTCISTQQTQYMQVQFIQSFTTMTKVPLMARYTVPQYSITVQNAVTQYYMEHVIQESILITRFVPHTRVCIPGKSCTLKQKSILKQKSVTDCFVTIQPPVTITVPVPNTGPCIQKTNPRKVFLLKECPILNCNLVSD